MRFILASLSVALLASGTAAQETSPDLGEWTDYVPTTELYTAGDAPPDTLLVERLFRLAFAETCSASIDGGFGGTTPDVHDFRYRPYWDEADAPERLYRLYRFNCSGGAYNLSSIFYGWSEDSGLEPLSFAVPDVRFTYPDDDELQERPTAMALVGLSGRQLMTNVEVDEATGTIYSASYWRGLGDASSTGSWVFIDGQFMLATYDVDGSYDGEVNPVRVVDYSQPIDVPMVVSDAQPFWTVDDTEDEAE